MANKILLEAARSVAEGEEEFSCCAVDRAAAQGDAFSYGRLACAYAELMAPEQKPPAHWMRSLAESPSPHERLQGEIMGACRCDDIDSRHLRVILLCMAAQVLP